MCTLNTFHVQDLRSGARHRVCFEFIKGSPKFPRRALASDACNSSTCAPLGATSSAQPASPESPLAHALGGGKENGARAAEDGRASAQREAQSCAPVSALAPAPASIRAMTSERICGAHGGQAAARQCSGASLREIPTSPLLPCVFPAQAGPCARRTEAMQCPQAAGASSFHAHHDLTTPVAALRSSNPSSPRGRLLAKLRDPPLPLWTSDSHTEAYHVP